MCSTGVTGEADVEVARLLATEHAAVHSGERVWQQERFVLHSSHVEPPPWAGRQQAAAGAYLWGSSAFGDNVEDEWLLVWLLLDLTRKLPGSTVRVWDNDGEFLLIEAAYALPKWLKPDTAANRVWLHDGALHLVPLPSPAAPSLPPSPTIQEALAIVAAESVDTRASKAVQAAVLGRIQPFGDRTAPPMHRARVTVPAAVAHILAREPQLLACAVEAFYFRDVAAMKAASRMARFPPVDLVTTSATFNRCLYAQLKQQSFQPPPAFSLPLVNSPGFAAAELGMKLTCGFEMLCASGKPSAASAEVPALEKPDVDSPSWRAFLAAAQRHASPGASPAVDPAASAERRFAAVSAYQQAADSLVRPVEHVDRLMQEPIATVDFSGPAPEDSDAWLAESGAELEAELQRTAAGAAAGSAAPPAGGGGSKPEAQLDQISQRMQAFLQEQSSYEGADAVTAGKAGGGAPELDASSFLKQLSDILGTADGRADDSDVSSGFYDDGEEASTSGSDEQAAPAARAHPLDRSAPQGAPRAGGAAAPRQRRGAWDAGVHTDTDSDDPDAEFMAEYSSALDSQLQGTHMARSFARMAVDQPEQKGQPSAGIAAAAPHEDLVPGVAVSRAQANQATGGEGLQPVDLDLNLVSNMLESFASQQGLPGPASNLAGMLGVPLTQLPRPDR